MSQGSCTWCGVTKSGFCGVKSLSGLEREDAAREQTYDAPRAVKARLAIVTLTLLPRLVAGYLTFGSVDAVANFRNAIRIFNGMWAETPYLVFLELWLWIASNVAYFTDLPVVFPYKLLPIACDALIALLLYEAAGDHRDGLRRALLFAISPVSIYITSIHTQWDSIWMYFLLLALVVVRLPSYAAAALAGAALALSVIAKPIAAPLVIVLLPLAWRRAAAFAAGAAAVAAIYLAILAAVDLMMSMSELAGIVRYAQHGIQRFGLPVLAFNRLWATLATLAGLWLLYLRRKLDRDEATLLFLCAAIGLSGLSPQYLCWIVPFALLCGRTRFLAIYTLVAGVFLVLYYQLPVVNALNTDNLGTYGLLDRFGAWSPPLPDPRMQTVARILGNYAIPLLCLGYVGFEVVHAIRENAARPEPAARPPLLRYALPAALLIAAVGAATIWTARQPRIDDWAFIGRIEQKIEAYDLVRYRGPSPRPGTKIWIARSFTDPAAGNRILNISTFAALWVVASSAITALWRREPAA